MSNENTIGKSQIDAIRKYQETNGPLLEVKDLQVDFTSDKGQISNPNRLNTSI